MSEAMAFEISADVGLRFGNLTPEEFSQIADGYMQRQEREWYRTAWMVCYLLAPWSKKKLTPEKLLGPQLGASRRRARHTPETED